MRQTQNKKKFKKDIFRMERRGKDIQKLKIAMDMLLNEETLPYKYKNHKLIGNYQGCWECHIEPDWLMIYKIKNQIVIFERTGTHSDLFD